MRVAIAPIVEGHGDEEAVRTRIDVSTCRRRSRSFDKLCREIEAIMLGHSP